MEKIFNMSEGELAVYVLLTIVVWLFKELRNAFIEKERMILSRMDRSITLSINLYNCILEYQKNKDPDRKRNISFNLYNCILEYQKNKDPDRKRNISLALVEASSYLPKSLVKELLNELDGEKEISDEKIKNILNKIEEEFHGFYFEQSERIPIIKGTGFLPLLEYFINIVLKPLMIPAMFAFLIIMILLVIIVWVLHFVKQKSLITQLLFMGNSLGITYGIIFWLLLVELFFKGRYKRMLVLLTTVIFTAVAVIIFKVLPIDYKGIGLLVETLVSFIVFWKFKEKRTYNILK